MSTGLLVIGILGLLGIALLAYLLGRIARVLNPAALFANAQRAMQEAITAGIRELKAATAEYGAVVDIASLARQLREHPGLIKQLDPHADTVVAAALNHEVQTLAAELKRTDDEIAKQRGLRDNSYSGSPKYYDSLIADLNQTAAELREQLLDARRVLGEFIASSQAE